MILNEDLDFLRASDDVKRAFLRPPDKMRLNAGVRLYKFTDWPPAPGIPVSPWWFFVDALRLPDGTLADGLSVHVERAKRINRTHREYARARAAISERFGNAMTYRVVIELRVPAWGFAGVVSGQPEFGPERTDAQHVIFIGGAHQLWIPGLTFADVRLVPVVG